MGAFVLIEEVIPELQSTHHGLLWTGEGKGDGNEAARLRSLVWLRSAALWTTNSFRSRPTSHLPQLHLSTLLPAVVVPSSFQTLYRGYNDRIISYAPLLLSTVPSQLAPGSPHISEANFPVAQLPRSGWQHYDFASLPQSALNLRRRDFVVAEARPQPWR